MPSKQSEAVRRHWETAFWGLQPADDRIEHARGYLLALRVVGRREGAVETEHGDSVHCRPGDVLKPGTTFGGDGTGADQFVKGPGEQVGWNPRPARESVLDCARSILAGDADRAAVA